MLKDKLKRRWRICVKNDGIQWGQLKHAPFRSKSVNSGWEADRQVHVFREKTRDYSEVCVNISCAGFEDFFNLKRSHHGICNQECGLEDA